MSCLGFKGGIGSASRLIPSGHVVGVLVMSNFGDQERLTIDGVPVGRLLPPADEPAAAAPPAGSCIVVAVTDAPLDSAACVRLARRAGLGLARTGSTGHHASGEIFLALATGLRAQRTAAEPGAGQPGGAASRCGPAGAGQSGAGQPGAGQPDAGQPGPQPITGRGLDPFFAAVVEATEEAVLNSMLAAPTVTGRDGNCSRGLPAGRVRELLAAAGRL